MDVIEKKCCENNDVVDAVEDKCRSQGNYFPNLIENKNYNIIYVNLILTTLYKRN